jgi:hypothetical protein
MIRGSKSVRSMSVVQRLGDVPEFATERQEADFWATHELGEEFLEAMGPLEPGILPPTRIEQRHINRG